jgi:diacylglycerol O-acyltransferase / wax synthase
MKQLSGLDYAFLQLERGNNYMHVAGLGIYDPSSAPGGKVRFKDILRFFSARIERFPHFRRRLVTVPWSLDRPWWVEDADLDVEFHVRHIALPQPGDWRQLCIQVARLHSRPLDRSKPLWEAYVIEGLHNVPGVPPGSFALYTKLHHSLIDGEAGSELTRAIHSLSPDDVEAEDGPGVSVRVADREPSAVEIYSRALASNLQKLPELARFSFDAAARVAGLGTQLVQRLAGDREHLRAKLAALASGDLTSALPRLPPATRFSGRVSSHRVFEAVGVPIAELKLIRQVIGDATINDLFLTIVGGALNRYLGSRGELPAASIVAAVPLTVRGTDKSQDGNQVGMTLMPVHSEIAEPIERLHAIRADAAASKRISGALGRDLAMNVLEHLPTPLADAVLRNVRLPRLSLIASNVRGPDAALYMAGARLVAHTPISIVVDGIGLNCTGFSYAGTLCICAVSCREMLPDPEFFAACLREAFADLAKAAAEHGQRRVAAPEPVLPEAPAAGGRRRQKPARRRKGNGRRGGGRQASTGAPVTH